MPSIRFDNYPQATVACFDATTGELPRRQLDVERNNLFLTKLAEHNVPAILIGASTGMGHLRSPEELNEWFASVKQADLGETVKMALLRPEDGAANCVQQVETLKDSGFQVAFVRPGTNLSPSATDDEVVSNMSDAIQAAAAADMAVGVYSIPDVSGLPLRPNAVDAIRQLIGEHLVAVKVTEADYSNSTQKFIEDDRFQSLKIVQGWDPFLADALKADPVRCGVTSGPMSFALFQYQHILSAADASDWAEVEKAQDAVTKIFQSMQDDPKKFADLQRAKYIMGLGQPLLTAISDEQVDRVFAALEQLPRDDDRRRIANSLNLMKDGPFASRLLTYQ